MNLAVLSGRVSADIVLHYTKKGVSVVSFDIAVRKSFTKDAEGNYPTDFFHIVAWNRLMITKTNKVSLVGKPLSKQSRSSS